MTIAARGAGLPPVRGQSDHWAAGYLQAALEAGWYDWDEIPPAGQQFDRPISRQLAVKVIMRAFLPQARGDYNTESRKISDFSQLDGRYYEPVLAAYASGVAAGDTSGNFRPRDSLTRAEGCVLLYRAWTAGDGAPASPESAETPVPVSPASGGAAQNGWLQVKGERLCNEAGEPVVLRGMSSHGIHWFGQYASAQAMENTAAFGANVFRVAMYTGEGGYLSRPEAVKAQAVAALDSAIACGLYVILDWHILSDGDPMAHVEEAEAFFTEMAARYRNTPNVLYEICNEPNGGATWGGSVRPYAQRLVSAIRAQSPRAVILIGSSTWSQDVHLAAADPVEGENLMYTFHFYAGTHGEDLRKRLEAVLDGGLPVFVSEWGTSRADGSGGFPEETKLWLDLLERRGVSWCGWSLCDKNETSAALCPGTPADRPWTEADLSESGKLMFSRFGG